MSATLYQVTGPWKGRLATAGRPRGGEWLDDDLRALRSAGVDVLVSSLTKAEATELDLTNEEELSRANGMAFVSFPIEDRGVPASVQDTAELVEHIRAKLAEGK